MSFGGILTVTNGALEPGAEQQGAARDPARRAERLPAGSNVATGVRGVRRISMSRVVAHAPGKQLAPALFRNVSHPDPRCATATASGRSLIPFTGSPCKVRNPWPPGLS